MGQRDKEEGGGGGVRRQAGGGVKRKKRDGDYRDTDGEGKTPRKSSGNKRTSPPGSRIKPKHKGPPKFGAVGDIRKWLVPSYRENRLQKETTTGPQVLLETTGGSPSRNLAPRSLKGETEKDSSQRPPLKEPSKWSVLAGQRRRDSQLFKRTRKEPPSRQDKD